jgi:hypothetical protein
VSAVFLLPQGRALDLTTGCSDTLGASRHRNRRFRHRQPSERLLHFLMRGRASGRGQHEERFAEPLTIHGCGLRLHPAGRRHRGTPTRSAGGKSTANATVNKTGQRRGRHSRRPRCHPMQTGRSALRHRYETVLTESWDAEQTHRKRHRQQTGQTARPPRPAVGTPPQANGKKASATDTKRS